jgi:hypothetical protein
MPTIRLHGHRSVPVSTMPKGASLIGEYWHWVDMEELCYEMVCAVLKCAEWTWCQWSKSRCVLFVAFHKDEVVVFLKLAVAEARLCWVRFRMCYSKPSLVVDWKQDEGKRISFTMVVWENPSIAKDRIVNCQLCHNMSQVTNIARVRTTGKRNNSPCDLWLAIVLTFWLSNQRQTIGWPELRTGDSWFREIWNALDRKRDNKWMVHKQCCHRFGKILLGCFLFTESFINGQPSFSKPKTAQPHSTPLFFGHLPLCCLLLSLLLSLQSFKRSSDWLLVVAFDIIYSLHALCPESVITSTRFLARFFQTRLFSFENRGIF